MIQFRKLRYSNFLSVGNTPIEIDLQKSSATLVVGHNGAGKSSMLDALSFALFGKAHRNINKNQLINSINKKNTLVEVEFSVSGSNYLVRRGIKPNIFEIYKNQKLLNQESHSKDYQKILELNILKLNHKSFHQVVVLGSSNFIPFMQLAPYLRRMVIEDLLDISIFGKMSTILKDKTAELKKEMKEIDNGISITQEKIAMQTNHITELKDIELKIATNTEKKIKDIESEIGLLQKRNFDLQTKYDNEFGSIENLLNVSMQKINELTEEKTQLGDEVEVMVLEIDEERRRISLGMKQCKANPWDDFAITHKKGDKVSGAIKSITDFGVFIGLAGNIDGLVHLSDLSWTETGEEAVRRFKKGDELEAIVLAIDVERERVSLGVKQLEGDPFNNYCAMNDKGALVHGVVKSVEAKGAVIQLSEEVEGYLRASEISRDRVEDATTQLKEGDKVETMIINLDRKARSIQLSIKAKDNADTQDAMQKMSNDSAAASGTTSLGALLKAKLDNKS